MIISKTQALAIIKRDKMKLMFSIWHFSFNEIFFGDQFVYKKIKNAKIIYSKRRYNHAPTLIYTDSDCVENHNIDFGVTHKYDRSNKECRKVFWFLKFNV